MNVGYKRTPYNYKFCNCSWTVLHYQKVHFFLKSTAQQNFLATGLLLHLSYYSQTLFQRCVVLLGLTHFYPMYMFVQFSICDHLWENRPSPRILYFEKYYFKIFNALWHNTVTPDILYE